MEWQTKKTIDCIPGIGVLQHLTRVTKNLDIGAEFLYQANPMMPGGHIGITSLAARYRGKDEIFNWNVKYLNITKVSIGLPVSN